MKKILVLAIIATMTIGLVGCGGTAIVTENTVEPAVESTPEEKGDLEATVDTVDSTETEVAPEENIEAMLPEVKGSSFKLNYELVGMDMSKASYSDEDVLRLWFMVTNEGDRAETPDDIATRDRLVAYQGEEKLRGTMTEDNPLEEQVIIQQILPGTTVLCAETIKLVDDQVINITMTDDTNTFEFAVDPTNFTEFIPEAFVWKAVEDTSFFEPESDIYVDRDLEYKINTIEVLDGKDWMNHNDCKVLRILLDVTNSSDKEMTVYNPFTPFQDGVELKLGHPMDEDENVDIQINTKLEAGATRQIAQSYVLYNESSPVVAMKDSFGTVYNLK